MDIGASGMCTTKLSLMLQTSQQTSRITASDYLLLYIFACNKL